MKKSTIGIATMVFTLLCAPSANAQAGLDYFSYNQGPIVYKVNDGIYGYDFSGTQRGSMTYGNIGSVHVEKGLLMADERTTDTGLTLKLANLEWYATGTLAGGQDAGQGTVCWGSAYLGGATVSRIDPDNGTITPISAGAAPWGVACGPSVLYALDGWNADMYEIDAANSVDPGTSIGVMAEQHGGILYDPWDNVIWNPKLNAVKRLTVPGLVADEPITLPELGADGDVNATHLVFQGVTNAYLVDKSDLSTVITLVAASSPGDVALCGGYAYVASSSGVQVFNMAGVEQAQLTTDNSSSVACVRDPLCGNGTDTDIGEECDDGNNTNGDGCSATCQIETATCNNSVIETGETCDDGNNTPGDGCSATCQIETGYKCTGAGPGSCELACGDGVLDSGAPFNEECDNGAANNDTTPNACRTDCMNPTCGDDVIDNGETCDDGAGNSDSAADACRTDCQPASCGDDVIDSTEDCDGSAAITSTCELEGFGPGSLSCGGGCSYDFTACAPAPGCGDGTVNGVEECDDGDTDNGDGCGANCQVETGYKCDGASPTTCQWACGDGILDANLGEECDEGTDNSDTEADACRTDCSEATCGDDITDSDEQCDDGNLIAGDGCNAVCETEIHSECGDGSIDGSEVCDDGNTTPGDGCSASCQLEGDAECDGEPSVCTVECPLTNPLTFLEDSDINLTDRSQFWIGIYDEVRTAHPTLDNQVECFHKDHEIYVRWWSNSRSIGAIDMGYYTMEMMVFGNESGDALWEFPVEEPEGNLALRSGERLMVHEGQDVTTQIGSLGVVGLGTRGTADWAGVSRCDPYTTYENGDPICYEDREWAMTLVTSHAEVFELPPITPGGDPQFILVTPDDEGEITAVETTNATGIYPRPEVVDPPDPPKKKGCSEDGGSCSTAGSAPWFWVFIIIGLFLRRRKNLLLER